MTTIKLNKHFWLGEYKSNQGWQRYSLFHKKMNKSGGSNNTPIAEINIVEHPGLDGANPHSEVKISFRGDVKKLKLKAEFNISKKHFVKTYAELVSKNLIKDIEEALAKNSIIHSPYCVYVSVNKVNDFYATDDFWNYD